MRNGLVSFALVVVAIIAASSSALAHPHVWVTVHSEVIYTPDGSVKGIRHAWTFDDMFSTYAIQGIAHTQDGEFTREELSSLAEVNVTSLKEFDYFTHARVNGSEVLFAEPTDYWMEFKDSRLSLHFMLPLKTPVVAKRLQIEIYDPTIFVDFEPGKDNPVSLVGAPAGLEGEAAGVAASSATIRRTSWSLATVSTFDCWTLNHRSSIVGRMPGMPSA